MGLGVKVGFAVLSKGALDTTRVEFHTLTTISSLLLLLSQSVDFDMHVEILGFRTNKQQVCEGSAEQKVRKCPGHCYKPSTTTSYSSAFTSAPLPFDFHQHHLLP